MRVPITGVPDASASATTFAPPSIGEVTTSTCARRIACRVHAWGRAPSHRTRGSEAAAVLVHGILSIDAPRGRPTAGRLRWSTPVSGWHDVDGRKLFGSGDAAWELDGKEFTYARFELLDVEFNVAQR